MKKLILLLSFIPVFVFGQNRSWHPKINVGNMVADDTVLQASYTECGDIAGYIMGVTVWSDEIDTSVTVNFGASNKIIDSTNYKFSFEGFSHDSLPYRFYKEDHTIITNTDTSYQKSFERTNPITFSRPQLWMSRDSCKSGTIYFDFLFSKP